jgi:HD-GYP domain-containing protein (c-di-GMP phosphodiesterase class II)
LPELEVTLDDMSVSRLHAEVLLSDGGWVVRDRGSSNGTVLNDVRIARTPQPLRQGDRIRVGNLVFRVDHLEVRPVTVRLGEQTVQVELAQRSWAEADRCEAAPCAPRDEKTFLRLLRGGYRLAQTGHPTEALQEVLNDAVAYFGARRGGVFLLDETSGQLSARCYMTRGGGVAPPRPPGKTLATVALRSRQSLLFRDRTDAARHEAESAVRGELNSAVCAVLRAPEREIGVLHLDRGPDAAPFTEADLDRADALAGAIALGLERQQLVERHEGLFVQTVTALAEAVEMRDEYTGNHTQRVTAYALLLATEMGLEESDRRRLRVATLLHDIGKIAIDDQILRKPGRLSDLEFTQMKTHVLRGWEIIQMIPGLAWALPVVRGHHERWDGCGYPDGLAGEDIPLTARVVAVADAFDAMTSDRPYRPGMPTARAFEELEAGAGAHFDPDCVAAFLRARPQVEALLEKEASELRSAAGGSSTVSRQELERERVAAVADPSSSTLRNALTETPRAG